MASSSIGESGYVELGDLLLQWGKCTAQSTEFIQNGNLYACSKAITFPVEYSVKPVVMVTPATSIPVNANCGYASITTTGFKLTYQRTAVSGMSATWFAIGKKTETQ